MKPVKPLIPALFAVAFGIAVSGVSMPNAAHAQSHGAMAEHGTLHVTKSASCGCCSAWVKLAREEGYTVETTNTPDITSIKLESGVPGQLWACHTAKIGDYVIEGHVPFEAIAKLLSERPAISGIAVPGMPAGSPGMGNDPTARFDVIAYGGDASLGEVFYQAGQ